MSDLLSIWRSPIDQLALAGAEQMAARQPRCDNTIPQLPPLAGPDPQDIVAVWHNASGKTVGVPVSSFGGGAVLPIAFNTSFLPLTIYNYGNYVNVPGAGNSVNTNALAAMFTAMGGGLGPNAGGWAWIPNYSFAVNATAGGLFVPSQSIIQGLGSGGDNNSQFIVTPTTGAGDTFFQTQGSHTSGGTYFRNLGFQWASGTNVNDTAINLQTWGGKVQDCGFMDVPTAVAFGALVPHISGGLGCTMERCVIRYGISRTVPNNACAIVMSGEQAQVIGPSEFFQKPISQGGPTGCVGLGWGGGAAGSEHQVVRGIHLSDWTIGVDFGNTTNIPALNKGAQIFTFADNEVNAWSTCINLVCQPSTRPLTGGHFYNNTLEKTQNSNNDANPLVLIDPHLGTGGANNDLSAMTFIDNNIYSNVSSGGSNNGVAANNQYGVQINGGQAIRFIGGKIGNMGNNANLGADGSANVCIGGNCGTVTFVNVGLTVGYIGAGGGATGAGNSQWAVLITTALTLGPVTFDNCDMLNYGGPGPLGFSGGGSAGITAGTLFIRNCPGYNDQLLHINTITHVPTAAGQWAGNQSSNGGTSYYGPSMISFVNGGGGPATLHINGGDHTIPANAFGTFFLNSPYEQFYFSAGTLSVFNWVGY